MLSRLNKWRKYIDQTLDSQLIVGASYSPEAKFHAGLRRLCHHFFTPHRSILSHYHKSDAQLSNCTEITEAESERELLRIHISGITRMLLY